MTDTGDTSSDMLMAQMLQLEFDREHDAMLAVEERKVNGNSKGNDENLGRKIEVRNMLKRIITVD